MLDISMIIFVLALMGIVFMFFKQYKKIKATGELDRDLTGRDVSYESFKTLQVRTRNLWLVATHSLAIVISRTWARLTHYVSSFGNRAVRKLEERIKKHEHKTKNREQSIFLTTIKAYKHEIKKLKGSVSEELPRPRSEVDLSEKDNNI